jgi:uncharacterized protein YjbI with pentapeptide repeats
MRAEGDDPMADHDQLMLLKRSVEKWNAWRRANPDVKANLSSADLSRADLSGADLSGADLSGADLSGANLSGANLSGANIGNAHLNKANFSGTNLSGIDLNKVNLSQVDLSRTDLRGFNLSGAILSGTILSYANLSDSILVGADLSRINLSYADFSRADLRYANFSQANLNSVNFNQANLSYADLSYANLNGANFNQANLNGTNLLHADLEEANFTSAHFFQTQVAFGPEFLQQIRERDIPHQASKEQDKERERREAIPALRLRIQEEPLTAHHLRASLDTLISLYVKAWLLQQGRFGDFVSYAEQKDPRFEEEANLQIAELKYNSPADIKFNIDLNPKSFAEAVLTLVDAIVYAKARQQEKEEENRSKELDNLLKEETIRKERFNNADHMLEITKRAAEVIELLCPELDAEQKRFALQSLMKDISLLASDQTLEISLLPSPAHPKPHALPEQESSSQLSEKGSPSFREKSKHWNGHPGKAQGIVAKMFRHIFVGRTKSPEKPV